MFDKVVLLTAIACLLRTELEVAQASPLNLHTQLQAALQQVALLSSKETEVLRTAVMKVRTVLVYLVTY